MDDHTNESQAATSVVSSRIKLQPHQILFLNRQLASMARLNMPLAKGIKILAKEVKEDNFRAVLVSVQKDLEEGIPLSEALGKYPNSFSKLYLEVLKTGESSGNLAAILEELTSYSEAMAKIKNRIQEALMYPAIISGIIVVFVIFFLTYITPKIIKMMDSVPGGFERMRAELPGYSRAVFAASDYAREPLISIPLFLIFFAGVLALFQTFRRMGDSYDEILFRVPVFGQLFHRATLMKLTRTMRELLTNGVSMVNTLRLSTNIVGENRVKTKLEELTAAVEEGGSFSRNLASGQVFPETMVWKLQMAEEKGIVEDALNELAHEFESEVDSLTTLITKLLSPMMLVIMAGIVFVLFVATFMPLSQMAQMR